MTYFNVERTMYNLNTNVNILYNMSTNKNAQISNILTLLGTFIYWHLKCTMTKSSYKITDKRKPQPDVVWHTFYSNTL